MAKQNGLLFNTVSRLSPKAMIVIFIAAMLPIGVIYIPLAAYIWLLPLKKIAYNCLWISGIVFIVQVFLFGLILNKWQPTKAAKIFLLLTIILSIPIGMSYFFVLANILGANEVIVVSFINDTLYNVPAYSLLIWGLIIIVSCQGFAFALTVGSGWGFWLGNKAWQQRQTEDEQESLEL